MTSARSINLTDGLMLKPVDILAGQRLEVLATASDVFEEIQRRIFGDTVRYAVLNLFLEKRDSLSLSDIARELNLSRATTKAYSRAGRRYLGSIREAVERLADEELIVRPGENDRSRYTLNGQSLLVQWLLAVRSLRIGK